MCFSYSVKPATQSLPFDISQIQIPIPGFFFNGFDHPKLPIVTANEKWELAQWGLIPSWARTNEQQFEMQSKTLNARSESAWEKPAFREAWNNRPCIVLASGFFEWQHQGKMRIPYFITTKSQEPLWFAGLYEDARIQNQWQRTYTLLTTEAQGIMSDIHNAKNRMPVMLASSDLPQWLHGNSQERSSLCLPKNPSFLKAYPVNPRLNSNTTNRNEPWAILPYEKPQTELPF